MLLFNGSAATLLRIRFDCIISGQFFNIGVYLGVYGASAPGPLSDDDRAHEVGDSVWSAAHFVGLSDALNPTWGCARLRLAPPQATLCRPLRPDFAQTARHF